MELEAKKELERQKISVCANTLSCASLFFVVTEGVYQKPLHHLFLLEMASD